TWAALLSETEKEDQIITCKSGITIRTSIQQIREAGRATQGVKLIKLDEGDEIAAITQVDEQEEVAATTEQLDETTLPSDETLSDTQHNTDATTDETTDEPTDDNTTQEPS
ncbi:MAG: DNA gyrase C-terminal beta-propeller domain-containing protein, partial [Bacteroidota bacterium]